MRFNKEFSDSCEIYFGDILKEGCFPHARITKEYYRVLSFELSKGTVGFSCIACTVISDT